MAGKKRKQCLVKKNSMHLIVGLGNPGARYAPTRHNVGFRVVDHLAEQFRFKWQNCSFAKGLIVLGVVDEKKGWLLKPLTFMNNSGTAVAELMRHEGILPDQLLVVTDDYQLPFGQIRLRERGSDGGHNGLTSIIQSLQTEEFSRLRLGIGQPPAKMDPADYVLMEFSKQEEKGLKEVVSLAGDCCICWMKEGSQKAMDKFNGKKKEE